MDKSLYIAVPAYQGQCQISFVTSLIGLLSALKARGMAFGLQFIGNEAHIVRARNHLSQLFMESDYTHMLFVDADLKFDPQDVLDMLDSGKDLIALPCAKKTINWGWVSKASRSGVSEEDLGECSALININPCGEQDVDIMQPVEVRHIGTGVMLISRDVFQLMKTDDKEFEIPEADRKMMGVKSSKSYAWFDSRISDGMFMGEDYYFCSEWRKIGGKVFMLPYARTVHTGQYQFVCNIPKMALAGIFERVDSATELAPSGANDGIEKEINTCQSL